MTEPVRPCQGLHLAEHPDDRPSTSSNSYTDSYYLTACEGYDQLDLGSDRDTTSPRLIAALELVKPEPGDRILDVGCGRGETILYCARHGADAYGLDYSAAALQIVQKRLSTTPHALHARIHIARGDAKRLPFKDGSFDKVLMLDLVEHLHPWELEKALAEARRLLIAGGQLIIHTAPNRWYYLLGYPLYRLYQWSRGRRLPPDPRSRFPFHYLHVNEQDILGLRRSLQQAGFEATVWLENLASPVVEEPSPVLGPLVRLLVRFLLQSYPFRWVFRNDIFGLACKRE